MSLLDHAQENELKRQFTDFFKDDTSPVPNIYELNPRENQEDRQTIRKFAVEIRKFDFYLAAEISSWITILDTNLPLEQKE